ncbi:MAG TPA: YihY/virulence factor BrkB family protein [Candidatus Binatia bacterium]|nr:YihY/virulence factor BrkB family protein [Candidatus Binatia bacterium]
MIGRKQITLLWTVLKTTAQTFYQDNGFFLAMGLAFNLLLYFIPLGLMLISLLGYTFLDSERAMNEVDSVVRQFLPRSEQVFADNLKEIISNRGLLGLVGFFFFLIFSSTLFGSVRHVLNVVFQAQKRRGFIRGLFRDFLMMLITAILLMLSIGAGTLLALVRTIGIERFSVAEPILEFVLGFAGKFITLGLLASLFYVFYRYAPARALSRKALLVASLSATILFEFARWVFALYVTFAHETLALYGVLGGLMFFFFWLYYASLVFVLGAAVGFAYEQTRPFKV